MRKFEVMGTPVAKGRPRVTKWGAYTPEKTVNYENLVQFSYLQEYKNIEPLEGYLKIEIAFYMPIPKSTSKKNRELMIGWKLLPDKKPDIDNMIKSITDALNELAYQDDKQIVEVHAYKYYSEQPKAVVMINKLTR